MSRAEDALMRLYETADLRDELTDDEAEQMLSWAQSELTRLDASGADDATFEARVETLLDMLKQINRFAGRQGQFSAQADDRTPQQIAELAARLGHAPSPEQIAAAGTGDPSTTLSALVSLISAAPPESAQSPPPAAESTPAPAASAEPPADPASPSEEPPADSANTAFGAYIDEYDL